VLYVVVRARCKVRPGRLGVVASSAPKLVLPQFRRLAKGGLRPPSQPADGSARRSVYMGRVATAASLVRETASGSAVTESEQRQAPDRCELDQIADLSAVS
jgi:hypothetical protein